MLRRLKCLIDHSVAELMEYPEMKLNSHLLPDALTLFCLSAGNAQLLTTTVEQGEIEGVEHEGFALYKGIPYAEAPVGNLRWKAPVSKRPGKGVFKADKWGDRPP